MVFFVELLMMTDTQVDSLRVVLHPKVQITFVIKFGAHLLPCN